MFNELNQALIAVFGVTAVALSQSAIETRRRWACIFGLLGQPSWFYMAWSTEQWGVFVLCILYSASWATGFYRYWLNPDVQRDPHGPTNFGAADRLANQKSSNQ